MTFAKQVALSFRSARSKIEARFVGVINFSATQKESHQMIFAPALLLILFLISIKDYFFFCDEKSLISIRLVHIPDDDDVIGHIATAMC